MLKRIIILLIVVVLAVGGYVYFTGGKKDAEQTQTAGSGQQQLLIGGEKEKQGEEAKQEEAQPSFTVQNTTPDDIAVSSLSNINAPTIDGHAWFLLDYNSGQVIAGQNQDEQMEPASLTKLMTSALVFEALKKGQISLDQQVTVSPEARSQEGSRMFIEVNTTVSVKQLLQGMIVQSGNDATVQLAQVVGGSTSAFVQKMNERAKQWGLTNTSFADPAGLPSPNTHVSARDIVTVAHHLIKEYPEYYHYFSQLEFTYANIKQGNRNGLLRRNIGVDGLKTGHTQSAGYNLLSSAKRDGRRLIAVVIGTKSFAQRERGNQTLLDWGFTNFSDKIVAKEGQEVTKARVWEGKTKELSLGSPNQVAVTIPAGQDGKLQAMTQIDSKLVAPIKQNQVVGSVQFLFDGKLIKQDPLVALNSVERAGFFARMWDKIVGIFK